jgi:uncharacterized protein
VTPVLLDTGCIVAMLDGSEGHHQLCSDVVAELEAPLLTCESVITEACYLLRDTKGAPAAVLENVRQNVFLLPFRLVDHVAELAGLMKKYSDVPMSLADACLVTMANQLQTGRILTLDRDFKIYRWGKNRPFELLLEI